MAAVSRGTLWNVVLGRGTSAPHFRQPIALDFMPYGANAKARLGIAPKEYRSRNRI
jgi:hypothetical protein